MNELDKAFREVARQGSRNDYIMIKITEKDKRLRNQMKKVHKKHGFSTLAGFVREYLLTAINTKGGELWQKNLKKD